MECICDASHVCCCCSLAALIKILTIGNGKCVVWVHENELKHLSQNNHSHISILSMTEYLSTTVAVAVAAVPTDRSASCDYCGIHCFVADVVFSESRVKHCV